MIANVRHPPRESAALMQNTLDTWVGQELDNGRYAIESLLGKGGMGSVFLAVDRRLNTHCVVKAPNPALLSDDGFATRFSREIRSLVELDHPHVVRIGDVGEYDGVPYLVMAYLAGGSLEDRRARIDDQTWEPLAASHLRTWLPHVAGALDFIHARGYLHRDIKHGNILFDAHGHAFLGDFGIAKAVHSTETAQQTLTQAGVVGTRGYIAPEVLVGRESDGRADQYSLAVVVHESLSGRRLFDGANLFAVANQQTRKSATPLIDLVPTVPAKLSDALKRALSRDPGRRYSSCIEFAESLLESVSSDGDRNRTPVPHSSPTVKTPRQPNRPATIVEKPGKRGPAPAGMTMIEHPVVVETVSNPRRPVNPRPPTPSSSPSGGQRSVPPAKTRKQKDQRSLYWVLGIGGGVLLLAVGFLLLMCLFAMMFPTGGRVTGTLESGDELYTFGEYMDRYQFRASSGQTVTVRMMSDDFDTWIYLNGPGDFVEWNDDYAGAGSSYQHVSVVRNIQLNTSGVYEVIATSLSAGESGAYALEVEVDGSLVGLTQVDPLDNPYAGE